MLTDTLRLCSLRGAVSRRMFCPFCSSVLDCQSAVEVDATNDAGELESTAVLCGSCFDGCGGMPFLADRLAPLSVEVTDGRAFSRTEWAVADAMFR